MRFSDIRGNEELRRHLAEMVDTCRTGHAIMLEEKGGYGALPMAIALIQYLSCRDRHDGDSCGECSSCRRIARLTHPDVHYVFPVNVTAKSGSERKPVSSTFFNVWRDLVEKNPYFTEEELNEAMGIEDKVGVISVAQAREILSTMNMRSFEGGNRYMVIYLPERMNIEAANKLLKMIEEPFPGSYFFLITQSPEKVINTIRSRCLRIPLRPVSMENRPDTGEYMTLFTQWMDAALSDDLLSVLKKAEALAALGREKQKRFCLFAEEFVRLMMLSRAGIQQQSTMSSAAAGYASRVSSDFFEKVYAAIDSARMSVESNVNAKIVFCNLGNLLFLNAKHRSS